MQKKTTWIALFFLLLFLPAGVQALVSQSGDLVVIGEQVQDDLFATGGSVIVNAPVYSLVAAGGTIDVNAPVEGDVIAAGGTIRINAPVGGKVVLAGGTVVLNGSVGRNALVYGGTVDVTPAAVVSKDAVLSGGKVSSEGTVLGNLTVSTREFVNTGVAGHLDYMKEEKSSGGLQTILSFFFVFFSVGMLILGLLFLFLAPAPFLAVEKGSRERPLIKTLVGFAGILGGLILCVLLAITIVGIPIAFLLGMGLLAGILLSTLFVSSGLGRVIVTRFGWNLPEWQVFVIGFLILHLAFRIPFVGWIVLAVSMCLGFGALLYSVRSCSPLVRKGPD